jgi:hypothetical protein
LGTTTNHVAANIAAIQEHQAGQADAIQANHEQLVAKLDASDRSQQRIREGLETVTATTTQTALDVLTVNDIQNRQLELVQANQQQLVGRLDATAQGQQQIQDGLDTVTATTTQTALDVLSVNDTQNRQLELAQANQQQLVGRLDATAQGQQQIQDGLDTVTATTTQTALDVLVANEAQTAQARAMDANQQQLIARLNAATQDRQRTLEGLDTITATTTQTALDILAASEIQAEQAETMAANQQQLVARLDTTAQNQQQIKGAVDTITATTTQTALDVLTVSDNQAGQAQAMASNQQQLVARLDATTQGQQQIREGLSTISATTTQTALDVLAGNDSQTQQAQSLQADQQAITSELSTVTQAQQHVRADLDAVAATTAEIVQNVAAVGNNQTKLEQAFETNRQELISKLAEIAHGQQEWLTRFDAAQANIETMATSIASLEQRVVKLQGTLANSLSDINTLLDARQQQQTQFQETVREDVQSMGDSLVQLKDAQTGLEKRLQQMQTTSENQTEDLLSAIEGFQQKAEREAAAIPAEIKSSKAQPEEIALP